MEQKKVLMIVHVKQQIIIVMVNLQCLFVQKVKSECFIKYWKHVKIFYDFQKIDKEEYDTIRAILKSKLSILSWRIFVVVYPK